MNKSNGMKRSITLLCMLLIAASIVTACGGQGTRSLRARPEKRAPELRSAPATDNRPLEISILGPTGSAQPPGPGSDIFKAIEAYTNAKLTMIWTTDASIAEKVNVLIASNDMPTVTVVTDIKNPTIINAMQAGAFWELEPYLKDYPNLSQINPVVLKNQSLEGKLYSLPRLRPFARGGGTIRQDWLDRLGLPMPETIDDFYNVIKAFTLDDPDGNGKDDTYGLLDSETLDAFPVMLAAFGGGSYEWDLVDGKIVSVYTSDEYIETMKWFKRLYDEKLINPDFLVTKFIKTRENYGTGRGGITMKYADDGILHNDELQKFTPDGVSTLFTRIRGPKGDKVLAHPGFAGGMVIAKSTVKTEEELKRVLAVIDKFGDDYMQELLQWGFEGVHHEKTNGVYAYLDKDKYNTEINPFWQSTVWAPQFKEWPGDEPLVIAYKQMYEENVDIAVSDPTLPLFSSTRAEKGNELKKMALDARNNFILGEIDEAGFKAIIEEWRRTGGDQIIAELNESYAKSNSNP